jgi:hypothetical protein
MASGSGNIDKLIQEYTGSQESLSLSPPRLTFNTKVCIIDILLDSICVSRANEPVLADSYEEYLHLISSFGEAFLSLDRGLTALLLLRKVDRLARTKNYDEELELIINDQYFQQRGNQIGEVDVNAQ